MESTKSRAVALRSRDYDAMLDRVVQLIDEARRSSARAVNAVMTATYWLIGRHIVEFEQAGKFKAQYGKEIIDQLASDLTPRFGRGFTRSNLFHMRAFYAAKPRIVQTVSGQLQLPGKTQTASGKSAIRKERALVLRQPTESIATLATCFPLPWSAYVRLLSVKNE